MRLPRPPAPRPMRPLVKPGCRSRGQAPNQPPATTGRSDAASRRRSAQVALPVTTTVKPAGLTTYIDRWPRAGVVLKVQARPPGPAGAGWAGRRTVPLLVIRRTNGAALALVSSSEASAPSGVAYPSAQVTVPAPPVPLTVPLTVPF